jgi:hypothetical protein
MRVDPTHWGPPSCEGLLCGCCEGVVYESNPFKYWFGGKNKLTSGSKFYTSPTTQKKKKKKKTHQISKN